MGLKHMISGGHDTYHDHEGNEMPNRRNEQSFSHPFWKVMGFMSVALFGVAVYLAKSNIEKLDKLNDNQIRTQTLLEVVLKNGETTTTSINILTGEVQILKTKSALDEQRLGELEATIKRR